MVVWVQLLLGCFSLVREVLKYLEEQDHKKAEKVEKVIQMRDGIRDARNSGDTSGIEGLFASIGLVGRSVQNSTAPNSVEPKSLHGEPSDQDSLKKAG